MAEAISVELFRGGLVALLDEIFTESKNQILDENQSFFETLADVTAAEASIPISGQSGSIAAQVNHVASFVGWLNKLIKTGDMTPLDWAGTWKIEAVSDEEWQGLTGRLREEVDALRTFASTNEQWDGNFVTGAFQIVGHCAYHLGEVRQGLGVLRSPRA